MLKENQERTPVMFLEYRDKSSDIEQHPQIGEPQIKQYIVCTQPQNKWDGGATKPTGTSYNFDKVWSGAPDDRFGK